MISLFEPKSRANIIPRAYQRDAHDVSFRLWDSGEVGVLTRCFTGGGKTIMACLKIDTWLRRGPEYRAMVISYEKQLVDQFAQEVEDVLGIRPGIEMEKRRFNDNEADPQVVVASRQSMMLANPPEEDQLKDLAEHGITQEDLGACPKRKAKQLLRLLSDGIDPDDIKAHLYELNQGKEAHDGRYGRLYRFDWRKNWLLVFDEAHRHAYKLRSVGPLVDWFGQNPNSRRDGLTATPKRADGVSLGSKMFPGVCLDYPLYSQVRECAVTDGYAVPYLQKYIQVEGVDFEQLSKVAGDFDDAELERVLGEEAKLAELVEPLLDLAGRRRTLVFSPGVEMAKNVSRYINARRRCICPNCQSEKWFPKLLIGDGAKCECGTLICDCDAEPGEQSMAVWGEIPVNSRNEIYAGHQSGRFQFLSVCGLCREGYNDRQISCVAIFRPVSEAASSLAEQMKGRGGRPLPGLIEGIEDREERLRLIAESDKPNCLIIDLVGVTGLADCASTLLIYAEGLDDEVKQCAQDILLDDENELDVAEAIKQAQQEIAEERERIRKEREEAERRAQEEYKRRAKAGASVEYSEHEIGIGSVSKSNGASVKQLRYIEMLGMQFTELELSKRQAGRIINMLKERMQPEQVAYENGIAEHQWCAVGPSVNQLKYLRWKRISSAGLNTKADASLIIDAHKNPHDFAKKMTADIEGCGTNEELDAKGQDLKLARRVLPAEVFNRLAALGGTRRGELRF